MKHTFVFAIFLFVISGYVNCDKIDPKSNSRFYVETFGQLSTNDDPLYSRVQGIFNQLIRVTGNDRVKSADLFIIDSESWPWALALPDNSIVLSIGAIKRCYRQVSIEHGDTRIALLLGHEIAHLTENDYWHRDVYLAISANQPGKTDEVVEFIGKRSGQLNSQDWPEIVRDRELKADDSGAIYALLAGYDISLLLPQDEQSFFQFWAKQISSDQDTYYLSADQRTDYLSQRISVLGKVRQAFVIGQSLIAMGFLDAAEAVYKTILTLFPAYEVYNNLGYIKLNQSKVQLVNHGNDQFWLPIQVDFNPKTPILLRGEIENYFIKQHLLDAIDYFELAVSQNPSYLNALLNLASTYFLAKKYNSSIAVLEQAEKIDHTDPRVRLMQSLALYFSLSGKVEINNFVYKQHKTIIESHPGDFMSVYNLALLYRKNQESENAEPLWENLAQNLQEIPVVYQKAVANQLAMSLPETSAMDFKSILYSKNLLDDLIDQNEKATPLWHGNDVFKISTVNQRTKRIYFNDEMLYTTIKMPDTQLKQLITNCCQKAKISYDSIIGDLKVYGQGVAVYSSSKENQSKLLLSNQVVNELKKLNDQRNHKTIKVD